MNKAPKWFMPVSIIALLWNLVGCAAYLADVMLSAEDIAGMTEAQQALYAARPMWAVSATAIAVWCGALGCLGLILRRKWSFVLLVLSLLGVIVQDIGLFGLSGAVMEAETAAFVLQGLVLVIAVALVLLGRKALTNEWLR